MLFNSVYGWKGWWGWWKPWANTIAYYPLNSTDTISDKSWNNYNLTNSWWVFWTYQGVDCWLFSGSNRAYTSISALPTWDADRTLLCWVYITQASGAEWDIIGWGTNSVGQDSSFWYHNVWWIWFRRDGNDALDQSAGWYMWNNWMLLTWVKSSAWMYFYVNGVQKGYSSYTMSTSWTTFSVGQWNINSNNSTLYISEAIVENKARTADEVSAYFNQTKSKYWIS